VASAMKGHDAVCHLGAIGDVYLAGERPDLAASVNVTGRCGRGRAGRCQGRLCVDLGGLRRTGLPAHGRSASVPAGPPL
jgi:hypothetical protein